MNYASDVLDTYVGCQIGDDTQLVFLENERKIFHIYFTTQSLLFIRNWNKKEIDEKKNGALTLTPIEKLIC